jgi:hypothetical protein
VQNDGDPNIEVQFNSREEKDRNLHRRNRKKAFPGIKNTAFTLSDAKTR